jgi:hypothetical protein
LSVGYASHVVNIHEPVLVMRAHQIFDNARQRNQPTTDNARQRR